MTCKDCISFPVCAAKPKHYTGYDLVKGKLTNVQYENPVKCEHFHYSVQEHCCDNESVTCEDCVHHRVCLEVENLPCRDYFIWYDLAVGGCPHFERRNKNA